MKGSSQFYGHILITSIYNNKDESGKIFSYYVQNV